MNLYLIFLHLVAHLGASFSLTIIYYGYFAKKIKLHPVNAMLIAALSVLFVGFVYKYFEGLAFDIHTFLSMTENLLGVGLALKSIEWFNF